MCISAGTAALITAFTTAAATAYTVDNQRKQANRALDAQRTDMARAEAEPTQRANARLALRRRALAAQSLVTDQGGGRPTLGG